MPRSTWFSPLLIAALLVGLGCARFLQMNGYPPHVFRGEAPADIEARALPVGAPAPSFTLPAADGSSFRLGEALKSGPAVIVFYRGHW